MPLPRNRQKMISHPADGAGEKIVSIYQDIASNCQLSVGDRRGSVRRSLAARTSLGAPRAYPPGFADESVLLLPVTHARPPLPLNPLHPPRKRLSRQKKVCLFIKTQRSIAQLAPSPLPGVGFFAQIRNPLLIGLFAGKSPQSGIY